MCLVCLYAEWLVLGSGSCVAQAQSSRYSGLHEHILAHSACIIMHGMPAPVTPHHNPPPPAAAPFQPITVSLTVHIFRVCLHIIIHSHRFVHNNNPNITCSLAAGEAACSMDPPLSALHPITLRSYYKVCVCVCVCACWLAALQQIEQVKRCVFSIRVACRLSRCLSVCWLAAQDSGRSLRQSDSC